MCISKLKNIELVVNAQFEPKAEFPKHFPLYAVLFLYETTKGQSEYGFRVKAHSHITAEDCFLNDICLSYTPNLSTAYRDLVACLSNEHLIDASLVRQRIKDGLVDRSVTID